MPLIVRIPQNRAVIANEGPYRTHINVLDRNETAVQRQLRRGGTGSYEPNFQATLLALCQIQDGPLSVYDIGAHIGFYSALISVVFCHRQANIVAFEPTPQTNSIARSLREKNGLAYRIIRSAVSDTCGTADLHLSEKAETSNSLNPGFRGGSEFVTVPLTTIDHFNDDSQLPPQIMKIDVETLEASVLRGALQTIRKYKPIVTLEVLGSVELGPLLDILRAIEAFGYRFSRVEAEPTDWRFYTAEGVLGNRSSRLRDWVCAPQELGTDFFVALKQWREALQQCGQSTNVLIKGGTPVPLECLGVYTS